MSARFHRVNRCFGVTLRQTDTQHVELWLCLSTVPPHTHPGQNAEIMPLFGWGRFFRVNPLTPGRADSVKISPRTWFRKFTIPADWLHWFSGVPLVFLNFNDSGVSAAERFAT